MSGPKISVYSLSPEMRKNFFEQQRCEREAVLCARQIEGMLAGISGQREALDSLEAVCGIAALRGLDFVGEKDGIQELIGRMESKCAEIREKVLEINPKMSAKCIISEDELKKRREQAAQMRALRDSAQSISAEIDTFIKEREKEKQRSMDEIARQVGEDLAASANFEYMEEELGRSATEKAEEAKKPAQARLAAIADDGECSDELRKEAAQAMRALERMESAAQVRLFATVTIGQIERRAAEYRAGQERLFAVFREKAELYRALCAEAGTEPKAYALEEAPDMEAEIHRLEQELIRRQEQAYISRCVDEVMSEMGYDLLGSRDVVKRSGKKFRNELYDFGDGTAVSVTYSSDGQIAMELGGIDRTDRLPTAEESDVLTEEMERFCGEFAVFERKLREKGIIVGSRIAHMPPSAEYAAIININDYDVRPGMRLSGFGQADERRTARAKKVMRRDE